MPDMDHLPRSIRHAWRQAAEAFCGGHDPVTVAERVPNAIDLPAAYPLRAMLSQAARLATAIESPDPWHALCTDFPDLTLAASALDDVTNARSELIDLQSRYLREWQAMPASMTGIYFDDGRSAA